MTIAALYPRWLRRNVNKRTCSVTSCEMFLSQGQKRRFRGGRRRPFFDPRRRLFASRWCREERQRDVPVCGQQHGGRSLHHRCAGRERYHRGVDCVDSLTQGSHSPLQFDSPLVGHSRKQRFHILPCLKYFGKFNWIVLLASFLLLYCRYFNPSKTPI